MAFGFGRLMPHTKEIDEVMTEFGRQKQCKYVTEVGRRGWTKPGARLGYFPRFTMIAKEI